jgi:hypothetical protein
MPHFLHYNTFVQWQLTWQTVSVVIEQLGNGRGVIKGICRYCVCGLLLIRDSVILVRGGQVLPKVAFQV